MPYRAIIVGSIVLASGAPAGADVGSRGPCTVSVSGATEGAAEATVWRRAVEDVRARVSSPERAADCRSIEVHVSAPAKGAVVLFTTADGRQASRPVESPAELLPVVYALLVTLPASAPAPAPAPRKPALPASPPLLTPNVDVAETSRTGVHPLIFATGGARIGNPGGFVSPSLGVGAGVTVTSWELTAFARWDPAGVATGEERVAFARYAAGIAAGRHVPAGVTGLAFGAIAGVAETTEAERDDDDADDRARHRTGPEPTLGMYASVLWPRRTALHARIDIVTEAVVSRVGQPLVLDDSLPAVPWWSLTASGGIEWEIR